MENLDQTIVNWVLGGVGTVLGFLLNTVWQAVKDLQAADKQLTEELAQVKVLVAGDYVKKEEFNQNINAVFSMLRRIEDKLDRKVDK